MRVISGKFRGTKLYALEGLETRPTLDRVKESLFNIINFELNDCIFLDLFAGSGAIGIEASSRGAKKVVMCEKSNDAMKIITKNLQKTRLTDEIVLYNMDYKKCILENLKDKFDIIFIDPPYKTDYAFESVQLLLEKKLVKENALIIIETDIEQIVEKQFEKLDLEKINHKKYGRACLLFYKTK